MTRTQIFSCKYCKIFKKTFFKEHLWTSASEQKKTYKLRIYLAHISDETTKDAVEHIVVIACCPRPYRRCHKDVASVAIYTLIDLLLWFHIWKPLPPAAKSKFLQNCFYFPFCIPIRIQNFNSENKGNHDWQI